MEHLLNETIAIFGKLRLTYLDIKASTQQTAHVWEVPDDIVFNLPDHFVERCYDMIDVMQMTSRFAELRSVQVGGSAATFARSVDQIIAEFHDALTKVKATDYDMLDIAASQYDDDFLRFRLTVRDCERRLGALMAERLETLSVEALSSSFKFLACFQVCRTALSASKLSACHSLAHCRGGDAHGLAWRLMLCVLMFWQAVLDRKIIQSCIEEREIALVEALGQEVDEVARLFEAGKSAAIAVPFCANLPHHAARVIWSRSLYDRVQDSSVLACRVLAPRLDSDAGRSIKSRCDSVVEQLREFQAAEIHEWLAHIDVTVGDKLKQPLLFRDLATSSIRVNVDRGLKALLREAKYLDPSLAALGVELPEAVRAVCQRGDVYLQHEANLHMMVNDYNALLSAMKEAERPLLTPKLQVVDEALEEGLELLNWRNHSIASFIKKGTSYISDAAALLKLMQQNVSRICSLLAGWSTASLYTQRKKCVGAEEYLETLKVALESKYKSIRQDCGTIHELITEIHLALRRSRGDPAWRQYVAHVHDCISQALLASVVETLRAIIAILDPAQRKESSAPLLELRLELIAPDVFFSPDVASNLSGSGLEDIVEFWVCQTLGVTKLMHRVDVGEGTYFEVIGENEEVLNLTRRLRELAAHTFEELYEFKGVYEGYSAFWLQEPAQQFAAFLSLVEQEEMDAHEELNAFDEQMDMLRRTEAEIKRLSNRQHILWVSVDAKPMKQALFTVLSKWSFTFSNHLVQKVMLETEEMQAVVTTSSGKLRAFSEASEDKKKASNLSVLMPDVMVVISDVKKMSAKADQMFGPWSSLLTMLQEYGVQVPSWVKEHIESAPQQWHLLKMHMFQCRSLLEDFIAREQARSR